jgi:hypothetical protein
VEALWHKEYHSSTKVKKTKDMTVLGGLSAYLDLAQDISTIC